MSKPEQTRKLFRRFALILAALLLLLVVISFVPLSSDAVRQKLIEAVAENSDYRLEIAGSFATFLSLNPGFKATDVTVREKDLPDSHQIETLAVNVSLMSLFFGDPVITNLTVEGIDIVLKHATEVAQETLDDASAGNFQIPEIKRFIARDVLITHAESEEKLFIDDLELSEELVGDNFQLNIKGQHSEQNFNINGTLGSLDQRLLSSNSLPIDLKLNYHSVLIDLQGQIDQPWDQAALAFDVSVSVPELSNLLKTVDVETPQLGQLNAVARLGCNLAAPCFEDLDVSLSKGDKLSLQLTGSIANIFALENDTLKFQGNINKDNELLNWALPKDLLTINQWQLQGILVSGSKLKLTDLDAEGMSPDGLAVSFKGNGLLDNFAASQPFSELDIIASFASENTAAARPLLFDAMPEMGPVQGELRIVAASDEALAFQDLDASIGSKDDVLLLIDGLVSNVPIGDAPNTGHDLSLTLSAPDSGKLAALLDLELPAIAPITLQGRWTGSRIESTFSAISLQAGKTNDVNLSSAGSISLDDFSKDQFLKDINLKVNLSSPDVARLARIAKLDLPELGPAKGNFTLKGSPQKLRAENIRLTFGKPSEILLKANGKVSQVDFEPSFKLTGAQLTLDASAPSSDKLSTLLDLDVPDFGAFKGKGILRDKRGNLSLEAIKLYVGPADKPVITATADIGDILKLNGVSWQAQMLIPADEPVTSTVKQSKNELDILDGDEVFSTTADSPDISVTDTGTDTVDALLKVNASGQFDDLQNMTSMDIKVNASARSLEVIGSLIEQDWPESQPANFVGTVKISKQALAIDGDLVVGKTEIITDIDGVKISPRMSVKGQVETDVLYLSDFGFPESEQDLDMLTEAEGQDTKETDPEAPETIESPKSNGAGAMKGKLFSQEPYSFDWLQNIDLDLIIQAGDIIGTGAKMDSFIIPVKISDGGVLQVSRATFVYDEGTVQVDYQLSALEKPAKSSFKISADDISIGNALLHTGAKLPFDGSLNINVDLSTRGQSQADMATNLNGIIEIGMEDMAIPKALIDLLGVDLFGWALSSTIGLGNKVKLDCGIMRLKAEQGLLTSELLFLDGNTLTVSGEGNVNLKEETIDVSVYPKKKHKIWANVAPVKVSGPLSSPTSKPIVGAEMGAAAAGGYAGLALAPQVVVPLKAFGLLGSLFSKDDSKGDNSACLKYAEAESASAQ